MRMRFAVRSAISLAFLGAAGIAATAQSLPPTSQELQRQHDQTIQRETNQAHDNLTQLQIQQAQQPQPTPIITPSGRVIAHPPGYIPMPPNPRLPNPAIPAGSDAPPQQ